MPSTIANIADLLSDYRNVVAKNDDISYFYIIYQIMMMVGTILGPGSISSCWWGHSTWPSRSPTLRR